MSKLEHLEPRLAIVERQQDGLATVMGCVDGDDDKCDNCIPDDDATSLETPVLAMSGDPTLDLRWRLWLHTIDGLIEHGVTANVAAELALRLVLSS